MGGHHTGQSAHPGALSTQRAAISLSPSPTYEVGQAAHTNERRKPLRGWAQQNPGNTVLKSTRVARHSGTYL